MCNWSVFDTMTEEVIGTWIDISSAEEFLQDNEGPTDVWAVMPSDECHLPLYN
jgi:hypothetical protein